MKRTSTPVLSENTGMAVKLDMDIVLRLARHAAYLIKRCGISNCGRTSLQMMGGRKSLTEFVPFVETVMFKFPKVAQAVGSFEERSESGAWIGTTIRDDMSLLGTPGGVCTARAIKKKPKGKQWSQEMTRNIVGSPSSRNREST